MFGEVGHGGAHTVSATAGHADTTVAPRLFADPIDGIVAVGDFDFVIDGVTGGALGIAVAAGVLDDADEVFFFGERFEIFCAARAFVRSAD